MYYMIKVIVPFGIRYVAVDIAGHIYLTSYNDFAFKFKNIEDAEHLKNAILELRKTNLRNFRNIERIYILNVKRRTK